MLAAPGGPALKGTNRMLDAALENNVIVADRLRGSRSSCSAPRSGPDLDRALFVAVEAADAVLKLAFRSRPDGDPELIAECKHLVRRYLSGHLPRADAGTALSAVPEEWSFDVPIIVPPAPAKGAEDGE